MTEGDAGPPDTSVPEHSHTPSCLSASVAAFSCPLFSLLLFHVALEFLVLRETFFQFTPGSLCTVDDAVCWVPSTQHTHLILTFPSLTRMHLGSLAEGWTGVNSELRYGS